MAGHERLDTAPTAVQLPLGKLPLDPRETAKLPLLERIELYDRLALHPIEREVAEVAVAAVKRGRYGRPA